MTPQPRKKISRKKPGEKAKKHYFGAEAQAAIIQYQDAKIELKDGTFAPDYAARNLIYLHDIMPAFVALVENLINVYSYQVVHDSRDDLKNECLEFLYGVLDKWDRTRGHAAFSYFNIVGKHWLTIRSKQNAKLVQSHISLDNREAISKADSNIIDQKNVYPSPEDILLENDNISKHLPELVVKLRDKAKTDNERACVDAIEELVRTLDDIDLLSKRAVMLYIREITNMSSKQLSIVLSSLKKQYKITKEEMSK